MRSWNEEKLRIESKERPENLNLNDDGRRQLLAYIVPFLSGCSISGVHYALQPLVKRLEWSPLRSGTMSGRQDWAGQNHKNIQSFVNNSL